MPKFVKCININSGSWGDLTVGYIYEVIEEDNNYYKVEDDAYDNWYYSKRLFEEFVPEVKKPEAKKYVKCISTKAAFGNYSFITVGGLYEMLSTTPKGIYIVGATGLLYHYPKDNFRELFDVEVDIHELEERVLDLSLTEDNKSYQPFVIVLTGVEGDWNVMLPSGYMKKFNSKEECHTEIRRLQEEL